MSDILHQIVVSVLFALYFSNDFTSASVLADDGESLGYEGDAQTGLSFDSIANGFSSD